jgi:hypothetical protein
VELGNNAACEGILRDSNGCFIFVFAAMMHQLFVIEAELWGSIMGSSYLEREVSTKLKCTQIPWLLLSY